ncbi:MAG: phosphoribosyltransferase [Thermoplasmata archaeon]|nr:phosphoribosyltransferase [Thermoplasmata archaeon]MCI4338177.1 phosphoribosyltransferase [Thermoplasmata archaeon]MCI4342103.1 phosphoribosyltransferase [Thermoplasmata archaeon]
MVEYPRCRLTSWREIEALADRIAESVRRGGGAPDTLVGLTRGGWVPARLLADRLGIKRLHALRAQHWGVTATPTGKAELTESLAVSLEGTSVLVVDDITDTGESLELATEHVRARGPQHLESAALLHIGHSRFVPTHRGEEIPRENWVWVVFPWNYWEDLRTLAQRSLPEGRTPAGVQQLLAERCRWIAPLADVERALASGGP